MAALDIDRLGVVRTDWTRDEARAVFQLPFNDLLFHAQRVHRENFVPNQVQVSTLLSVKTGACPEDCKYCPQSVRYDTGLGREELMQVADVVTAAQAAKAQGATRFCMGAAYRNPKPKQLEQVKQMVREVRGPGFGFLGRGPWAAGESTSGSSAARAIVRKPVPPPAVVAKTEGPRAVETSAYPVGATVKHPMFGTGKVIGSEGSGPSLKLTIHFVQHGAKKILPAYTQLLVQG